MHKEDGVMKSVIQMWDRLEWTFCSGHRRFAVPTSGESRGGRDVMSPHWYDDWMLKLILELSPVGMFGIGCRKGTLPAVSRMIGLETDVDRWVQWLPASPVGVEVHAPIFLWLNNYPQWISSLLVVWRDVSAECRVAFAIRWCRHGWDVICV